jgi:hypothetical protein
VNAVLREMTHVGEPRKVRCQILGDPVREVLLVGVVTEIGEWQHDDREPRRDEGLRD